MGEVAPQVTERASPAGQSRRTAISRLFVRGILSRCGCITASVLALSGALRQLSLWESQKVSLNLE